MSIIPKTVNQDLQKERQNAKLDVTDFALWWHGGIEKLKLKRKLESHLLSDMYPDGSIGLYKSYKDIYTTAVESAIKGAKILRQLQKEYNPGGKDIWPYTFTAPEFWAAIPEGNPFVVQTGLSRDVIRQQGTDEQIEKFGKRLDNFEISVTYAQTELGHGTYLRGLQTRADFDREKDEFILNTPSLTAYKWWPGGLGHSVNYCVVVANLYIDNDQKGLAMFIVQVRDEETHKPLPGIDVGDVGMKMGSLGANNGYLGLKNVRIPRTNMLMRNMQVQRDGLVSKNPLSVLAYFGMVLARCKIAHNGAIFLSMAATIATRYSAVRRQSRINENAPEPQIIDHTTQQMKLFPEIATSVAYKLAAGRLWALYEQTAADIQLGEYTRLSEMHALACVMKALSTSDSANGVERLRLACGGHGYLTSSNLGNLYASASAACTYEGENTVLLLQAGRFLMKSYRQALDGQPLPSTMVYVQDSLKNPEFGKWTGSWKNIVNVLQHTAASKIRITFENLTKRLRSGQTEGEAANHTGIEYIQAAELHGRAFVSATFLEDVTGPNVKSRKPAVNKVLEQVLELYLVHIALRHMNDILRFTTISDSDIDALQHRLEKALKDLRPNAVAICDGFDYHDNSLKSTLGSYDGNAYERIFEAAKRCTLNEVPVPEAFETHLKPFMKSNL